jgi:transposase InsO family protein
LRCKGRERRREAAASGLCLVGKERTDCERRTLLQDDKLRFGGCYGVETMWSKRKQGRSLPWHGPRPKRERRPFEVRLPRRWPKRAKSGLLHALGVARWILATLRGEASSKERKPLDLEDVQAHVNVLVCENKLLRGRLASIPAARRPHYQAEARMEIVQLRAAQGWTLEQTAARFLVTVATLSTWTRRVDEEGPGALVRKPPVNKYPELVTQIVSTLDYVAPMLGAKRIAQWLAGMGLVLSASTVRRRRQQKPAAPPPAASSEPPEPSAGSTQRNGVTAKHEHHVWHIDLTFLPTTGPWVPWLPFALPITFPFYFCLAGVVDQWSRRVVGWKLFLREPTAKKVVSVLDAAVAAQGRGPTHIISDQGPQFRTEYLDWCRANDAKPRFGAIGKHGSIAVIERFWRTLKSEGWRRLLTLPWSLQAASAEIGVFVDWYHEHRPHQGIGGQRPGLRGKRVRQQPRIEVRRGYCSVRDHPRRVKYVEQLRLSVEPFRGREHLPVLSLHY